MDARSLLDKLQDDATDELDAVRAALAENPDLPAEFLALAEHVANEETAPPPSVIVDLRVALSTVARLVQDPGLRGRLHLAQADLMLASGDSDQYVLEAAIQAAGWNPDLDRAYELTFDQLRGSSDLDWTEAMEKIEGRLPKDALALLRHVIERAEAGVKTGEKPYFLRFDPTEGATLADAAALVAGGLLAEAVAARRGATGEDFPTARRAVFGG